jgi:hypothetical protein
MTSVAAARGAAFGDFNNDGVLDIAINCVNEGPQLLRGDSVGAPRSWIKFKLVGVKSNRTAIGARVKVTALTDPATPSAKAFTQMGEVSSGGSYFSQSDLRVHFGLGAATKVDKLEIRWPNGSTDVLGALEANRLYTVQEGGKVLKVEELGKRRARKS